ncbi:Uncharacterised protein [Halioglobus japonicus]|nr:Uncharacterised protein [Halioglobus japonicus]
MKARSLHFFFDLPRVTLSRLGWQLVLCFAMLVFRAESAFCAPYPPDGLFSQWVQPDGAVLQLKMYGDEFYARTTTDDGYTVIFSTTDNAYYYAEPENQGKSLRRSNVSATLPPPAGLKRQLKEPRDVVSAIRAANIARYAPERAARWEQRKNAVQRQRNDANPAVLGTGVTVDAEAPHSAPNLLLNAPAVTGARVGLVILVQFPDDPATAAVDPINFPTTQSAMERYSNEVGYTDNGNTGSIRDYYTDQSSGALDFTQVVTQVVTLPHPRNYYNFSNYPANTSYYLMGIAGRMLVTDAIAELQASGFDFSALSVDAYDRVLATSLMFAGNLSGVWAQGLWPHAWTMGSYIDVGTIGEPRNIYAYQITNVPNAAPVIGTMCHELGHLLLAYPDFYDTDASDGASEGVGEHSLMGSGNYLNGGRTPAPIDLYLKDFSGWATITDLSLNVTAQRSLTAGGDGYRIRKPGSSSEYFLIENRSDDDRWASYSPDKGIAIWHVDEAVTTDNKRQQMTPTKHYELSLEQADGLFDLEANRDRGDSQDLFDSFAVFNDSVAPNANWWDGTASGIRLQVLNPAGTPAMHLQFFSDVVQLPIGEALDNTTLLWSEGGLTFSPGSWYGELSATAQDGIDQATHYPIADSEEASVSTAVTGPGSLSFWWKVSSETGADYLSFYRDELQHPAASPISGESGWQLRTIPIPTGVHTLRWTYSKNASVAGGADTAWLDGVVFTPGAVDSDGDGLSDDEEILLGTDPNSVDSDGDGLVDGAGGLVLLSTYASGIDGNGDGFVDGEADFGTDPTASNIGDLAPRGSPNNIIDTGDQVVLMRFLNGLSQPDAVESILADIDGDGDIDVGDLVLLKSLLAQ